MVRGRLPRESNPVPGERPGYVASFDKTGNEDYERVSPNNPYPVANYIQNASGVWVPVNENNPVPTRLTGSNVEETYNGERVLKTRTMGLTWKSFNPFNAELITLPEGTYVDRSGDSVEVNGYTSLALIIRDTVAAGRGEFYVSVYWTGKQGIRYNQQAVPERFDYDPDENQNVGLSLSIPTKAEYVSFRLFNLNGEERTFYVKGLLRA